MNYHAPLENLFTSSRLMILDFAQIPRRLPDVENIQLFFAECHRQGIDPRLPENRQAFNNRMIDACQVHYLVSRYAEDRSAMLAGSQIAREGRTYHLGVDIFAKNLEPVFAPCDGEVVRFGAEPGPHSFGHYFILRTATVPVEYMFFGHLSKNLPPLGPVLSGQQLGWLGDYAGNENGGWSRHLHLQRFSQLPLENDQLIGYANRRALEGYRRSFPDPMELFPEWKLSRATLTIRRALQ